jgi:hypothetical protein
MMEAQQLNETLGGKWFGSYGSAPCPVYQPERRRDQVAQSPDVEGAKQ